MSQANLSAGCCSSDQDSSSGLGTASGIASIPMLFLIRLGLSLIVTVNSIVVAISFNTSELTQDERRMLSLVLLAATLVVIALLGWPLVKNLWSCILKRRLSMEALFATGMIGAIGYSAFSMARQTGAIYFEVVNVLLVIYSLGSLFKSQARQRATQILEQWSPTTMTCYRLFPAGGIATCPVSEILAGDLVRVFPGQLIPIDGIVVSGQAQVKQTNLTGEPFPVLRAEHDAVQAATHCIDGTLTIRASADGDQRSIDGIMGSVQEWSNPDSALQRQTQGWLRHFFRVVIFVCIATLLFWGVIRSDWESGILNALAVLLVACPCAIGFARPIGIWSGMARLAGYGLYLHDATTIEKLGAVKHIILDKTGTLTEFEPELAEFSVLDGANFERDELLEIIGAVEQISQHPIASVFKAQHQTRSNDGITEVLRCDFLPGRGVSATVQRTRNNTHHATPMSSQWSTTPEAANVNEPKQLHSIAIAGPSREVQRFDVKIVAAEEIDHVYHGVDLVVNEERVGFAKFVETPLEGLGKFQADLAAMGIRISLLSGDSQQRVDRLGFSEAFGRMTAQDKLKFVQQHQSHQPILFVGDGVNDAPAMNAAAVSFAINDGAELAMEMADGVWNRVRLVELADAIQVCRLVTRTIRSNVMLAATYNAIGMSLAATGLLHPVAAALLMLASSLTVTVRSTRILDSSRRLADPIDRESTDGARNLQKKKSMPPHALANRVPLVEDQEAGNATSRHLSASILGVLSWLALAIMPKCPLCWSAYLSLAGLSAMQGTVTQGAVLGASAAFGIVYLTVIARRCWTVGRYGPLVLSVAGAAFLGAAILFNLETVARVTGLLLLLTGSGWSAAMPHAETSST